MQNLPRSLLEWQRRVDVLRQVLCRYTRSTKAVIFANISQQQLGAVSTAEAELASY